MNSVKKLYACKLTYAALINEFAAMDKEELIKMRESKLSFVDWLMETSFEHLSKSRVDSFCKSLFTVIKQKLEIVLSAMGPMKLSEIPSKVLRSIDFVSVEFLRKLVSRIEEFQITVIERVEYLDVVSKSFRLDKPLIETETSNSIKKCSEKTIEACKSDESSVSTTNVDNTKTKPSDSFTSPFNEEDNKQSQPSTNTVGVSITKSYSTKSEQLRFLYQSQPDIIAALHPSVTLNSLFKSYTFWKTFCLHSKNTFISWMLEMAECKYSNISETRSESYNAYNAAVKRLVAEEAYNYVTAKSRTVKELTTLVSKGLQGFVDAEFVLLAIQENSNILKTRETALDVMSSQQVSLSKDKKSLSKPKKSAPQSPASTLNEINKPSNNRIKASDVSCIDSEDFVVIDSVTENDSSYYLQELCISVDVRAKIVPLLTINVSWSTICCTLKKIAADKKLFLAELAKTFESFLGFLFAFAARFKPSLDAKDYTQRLEKILKNIVSLKIVSDVRTYDLDEILCFVNEEAPCGFKVVSKRFLRKVIENAFDQFILMDDAVSLIKEEICKAPQEQKVSKEDLKMPKLSCDNTEDICLMTKEEIKSLPQLNVFFSSKFGFCDFLQTFKSLPAPAKDLLKKLSCSFYSLLLEIARSRLFDFEHFLNYFKEIISSEIAKIFELLGVTTMMIVDIQLKLGCGDCSLIHGLEIVNAVSVPNSKRKFELHDSNLRLIRIESKTMADSTINLHLEAHQRGLDDFLEQELDEFVRHTNFLLENVECEKEKLGKIFYGFNNTSVLIRNYMADRGWSYYGFLNEFVANKSELNEILRSELFNFLQNDTLFCEVLMTRFFQFVPDFIIIDEFINFLKVNNDSFVVVGHFQVGNIVSTNRRADSDGNILFFNKLEKDTFGLVKKVFPKQNGITFMDLFDFMWDRNEFLLDQHRFVFGEKQRVLPPDIYHQIFFRRYFLMYPSEFHISNEQVYLKYPLAINSSSERTSALEDCRNTEKNEIPSESEEGELTSHDESEALNPAKRMKADETEENSRSLRDKRKRKRKRKKTKNRVRQEPHSEDVKKAVSSLPDYFIEDIVIGRLMSVNDHRIKICDIFEMLKTNLLREKQEVIDQDESIKTEFETKVIEVLQQSEKIKVITDTNSLNKANQFVTLKELPSTTFHQSLVVFRFINRLTGVSMKKISAYVQKILRLNRTPLSMSIIFSMISQKYGTKKTVTETPSSVLHCQTVACIASDSEFFLNVHRKTCSLAEWISESEKQESFQKTCEKLTAVNAVKHMVEFLQMEKNQNGQNIEELTSEVASKFPCNPPLSFSSVQILVQGLIGGNQMFGFTPQGKVVYQHSEPTNSSANFLVSSSEDDLKIDISDDESSSVFPDSTNKEIIGIDKYPQIEMRNKYIESEVIRFPFDNSISKKEANSADSTTSDTTPSTNDVSFNPSFTELRKDPRILLKENRQVEKPSVEKNDSTAELRIDHEHTSSLDQKQPARKLAKQLERTRCIERFAIGYFSSRGNSSETQAFVNSAYHRLKNERFARSMLAFEAYIRDFVATSKDNLFSFANANGDVGTSYTFYRPVRTGLYCRVDTEVPFVELLPKVFDIILKLLNSKPDKKVSLYDACDLVADSFSSQFSKLAPDEIQHVSRNLTLLACIRNLKWFFFAKSEPYIYVRAESKPRTPKTPIYFETSSKGVPNDAEKELSRSKSESAVESKQRSSRISAASNTLSALEKMAELLRIHGPCKKTALRELWIASSDANHRKIFGTGVSFSLSLRNFEICFPTVDGLVRLDEKAFADFLKDNFKQL